MASVLLSRIYFAAPQSSGSQAQIPPLALGPAPSISSESSNFSYQINAYGTLPMTFNVTSGSLPNGMSMDVDTGLITGTTAPPFGGLYNFTVTIENAYGTIAQPYAILINGTAATISQISSPDAATYVGGIVNTLTATLGGSTGGDPAVPITCAFVGTPNAALNASINSATGDVTMTPANSLVGNYVTGPTSRATNYFGNGTTGGASVPVLAPVYWGEWHGALPGAFTSNDIKVNLFDNTTPGPRVKNGLDSYAWLTANPWLAYPVTVSSYPRVLAISRGLLIGDVYAAGGAAFICDTGNIFIPCVSLTPAWPTPYTAALTIDGVIYDIYVVTSRTLAITLLGNWI